MTSQQHAFRAYRLRERSKQTMNPYRRRMLEMMAKSEMALGLSKTHREFGSPAASALERDAFRYLLSALQIAKLGKCS